MNTHKNTMKYLYQQRWCNFKSEIVNGNVRNVAFDTIPLGENKLIAIGRAEIEGEADRYFMMPLQKVTEETNADTITLNGKNYKDAVEEQDFWSTLTKHLRANSNKLEIPGGWILEYNSMGKTDEAERNQEAVSHPLNVEQSNSTVIVEGKNTPIAFKLERMLAFSKDENPEFDMNNKLMREESSVMPQTYGYLVLYNDKGEKASSGIVQEFIKNKGDMWNYSINYIKQKLHQGFLTQTELNEENCSEFMELAATLGQRTQEMTDCFSKEDDNPDFTPEPVNDRFLHIYQKQLQALLRKTQKNIADNLSFLSGTTQTQAQNLLNNWDKLTSDFIKRQIEKINNSENKGTVCRVHGDFHLGQVLVTENNDLKFIDFAGEPALPIDQRKQKHISVRDYAGMYRSLNGYLGAVAAEEFAAEANTPELAQRHKEYAQKAIKPLMHQATKVFLGRQSLQNPWMSMEIFRKNLYEVNYEVCHRPQMAYVPIEGLSKLLEKRDTINTRNNGIEK